MWFATNPPSVRIYLLASTQTKADRLAASIAQALSDAGLNEGRPVKPSDMLRFGMGLGITLGANGLLTEIGGEGAAKGGAGGDTGATGGTEASLAPPVVKVRCASCNL